MESTASKPRLILHFDLNKTVVPSDIAGGKSLEDVLNNVVAECAWGIIDFETMTWTVILFWPNDVEVLSLLSACAPCFELQTTET